MTPSASFRSRIRLFLRSLLHRRRFETDIDDEIRFHLEARTADLIAHGLPPREAARQARLEFGATESHKDGMRSALGLRWTDDLLADLRYSTRLLRKSPGFTAIAVTSLALAIGANTAIFSVSNEMLYARLAVPRPRELRVLNAAGPDPIAVHHTWGENFLEGGQARVDVFPYPFFRQLQTSGPAAIFAFKDSGNLNVTANGLAQAVGVQFVSGNFYREMEVTPQLGRPILPSDDTVPGQGTVALLSDSFWRNVFGASPDAVGRTLKVNGHLLTVVGVNPPGFTGAQSVQTSPALFVPLSLVPQLAPSFREDPMTSNTFWWVNLMARIRPGSSPQLAQAALSTALHAFVLSSIARPDPEDHIPSVLLEDGSRGLNFSGREFREPSTLR